MAVSPPKPIVTSWDVFDTLVARFVPNPHAVFQLIEAQRNAPGFVARRADAQAALDRIGQPYVLHDIYRRMAAGGCPSPKPASCCAMKSKPSGACCSRSAATSPGRRT